MADRTGRVERHPARRVARPRLGAGRRNVTGRRRAARCLRRRQRRQPRPHGGEVRAGEPLDHGAHLQALDVLGVAAPVAAAEAVELPCEVRGAQPRKDRRVDPRIAPSVGTVARRAGGPVQRSRRRRAVGRLRRRRPHRAGENRPDRYRRHTGHRRHASHRRHAGRPRHPEDVAEAPLHHRRLRIAFRAPALPLSRRLPLPAPADRYPAGRGRPTGWRLPASPGGG